jgi:hypothetical protein
MTRLLRLIPVLFLAAAAAAFAQTPNAKSHANSLSGTVTAVDAAGKSVTVRDGKGKETRLVVTGATRVTGGTVKSGAQVTVRWMLRDKKSVATVIKVHTPEAESTASAAPPSGITPRPKNP